MDTEFNKPLKAKCCTQEEDMWPSLACQSAREEIEETATATDAAVTCGRQRLSARNRHPTLRLAPSSCPILRSCTVHLEQSTVML